MGLRFSTVLLENGVAIPCVERGDPAGPALLLLHGYSDSWRSFEPLLEWLPASLRAVAITQRGHREASKPSGGYSPEDFAGDALALLNRLEIERAVLVGHSMGSVICEPIAIDAPDRIAGLVLIGAFAGGKGYDALKSFWRDGVAELKDPIEREFVHDYQAGAVASPLPDGLLDSYVEESLKAPAHVWRQTLRASSNGSSAEGRAYRRSIGKQAPLTGLPTT